MPVFKHNWLCAIEILKANTAGIAPISMKKKIRIPVFFILYCYFICLPDVPLNYQHFHPNRRKRQSNPSTLPINKDNSDE
jgi:hypothetical protein